MTADTLRLVVAEDSLLVREGITRLIEAEAQFDLVGVYADADDLLAAVDADRPDIVLTDVRMPPTHAREGIAIANHLRAAAPQTGVILLSQYAEAGYAFELFEGGAAGRGYMLKERLVDRSEVAAAVRTVAGGGTVMDQQVIRAILAATAPGTSTGLESLSPREREVLGQVATGKSNSAIAAALVVTQRAVERHINSIFRKLDLPADETVNRRVTATLCFLASTGNR